MGRRRTLIEDLGILRDRALSEQEQHLQSADFHQIQLTQHKQQAKVATNVAQALDDLLH